MRVRQGCSCGATLDVDMTAGLGPYLIDGSKRDAQNRMYRAEVWIDEWVVLHRGCVPETLVSGKGDSR